MPYVNPFDPTTPTDADFAHQGDDEIRRIKAALIERLKTIIPNFPDGDPLTLDLPPATAAAKEVAVGLESARPNPPAAEALLYYATDTKQLSVAVKVGTALEWVAVVADSGGGGETTTTKIGLPGLKVAYTPVSMVVDNYGPYTVAANSEIAEVIPLFTGVTQGLYIPLSLKYQVKDEANSDWRASAMGYGINGGGQGIFAGGNMLKMWLDAVFTTPNTDASLDNWWARVRIANTSAGSLTARVRLFGTFLMNQ